MKTEIRDFVVCCETVDFGKSTYSKAQKAFYDRCSAAILSLCRSLPESAQTDSILFLMQYGGMQFSGEWDFFARYHAPAWSILYWLSHDCALPIERLEQEDVANAVTAHSMAMFLHSLDDHLTDGQVPVSPLTLLLRSQAWMIMNRAFRNLAGAVPAGEKIVRSFMDDYYSGIRNANGLKSLDSYCDRFRRQMATWMIAPVLLSVKMTGRSGFTRDIEMAYGSFGVAWRLLDDIQDVGEDFREGAHTACYFSLPETLRPYWGASLMENRSRAADNADIILCHMLEHRLVEKMKEKICAELDRAALIVESHNLTGLAREFRCLAHPLTNEGRPQENCHGTPGTPQASK